MKKATTFSVFALATMLMACSKGETKNNDTTNEQPDTEQKADESATEANAEAKDNKVLETSDLSLFQLRGPVKCVTYANDEVALNYDEEGHFVDPQNSKIYKKHTIEDVEDYYYVRDKQGMIVEKLCWERGETYKWDGLRIIAQESYDCGTNTTQKFFYDDEGNLIRIDYVETEEDSEFAPQSYSLRYVIKKVDDYGNWTERIVKYDNGEEDYKMTRTITYYK